MVVYKTALAPDVGIDQTAVRASYASVIPDAEVIGLSAPTGENLSIWTDRLLALLEAARARF